MERWESEAAEGGIYRKFGYRMWTFNIGYLKI
jgi:predicted acetyltransferase